MIKNLRVFMVLIIGILISSIGFAQTPVSQNGALQVKGVQLSNQYGHPVQLKGMSSHGMQWYGDFINASSIQTLKTDWGADIIRLAMYVEEGGYINDPTGWKAKIKEKADLVIAAGLYVIIDWHVHLPGDPNAHTTEAKDFFDYFSKTYKDVPNVIFEICNEPNKIGDDSWSKKIKPYAEQIIPIIRANSANAIILVGTPIWSSKPGDVFYNPLSPTLAKNCLYSMHIYSGSHFTQEYINQFSDKLPIFFDEWGTSLNIGNGGNDYVNTQAWFDVMNGHNPGKQVISWCNWSFCDKNESSAALAAGAGASYNNTSASGTVVKNEMKRADNFITGTVSSPKIAVQPFSQKVFNNTNAYLRVLALGLNLNYQWYKDGNIIPDATTADYVVKNFTSSKVGKYKVVITNSSGTITSNEVNLSLETSQPNGSIQQLPGKVELEKYDVGAAEVTYHNYDVAITETTGDNGGKAITGASYNDWLKYTVNFTETGFYTFKMHAYTGATGSSIPQFWIALDHSTKTKIIDVPLANFNWTDVATDTVYVEKGTYVFKLLFEERLGNVTFTDCKFDYIQATKLNIDCNKTANGTAFIDSCGFCVGGTTGKTASLDTDKDGTYDCKDLCPNDPNKIAPGVCGCGVADGTCMDCFGVLGGTASLDDCGVCSGGTTGKVKNASCKDCNGDMNGTATKDLCNVCSGGTTGITPNSSCRDCFGVINGTAKVDNCGVCNGDNSTCVPCNGTVDVCGVCNGNGSTCNGTLKPYKGVRKVIPGKIEAEEYDAGGANTAYSDSDVGNNGSKFRTDDVDIDVNDNGGFAIGWANPNEWTKYSVTVKYTGTYNIVVRGGTPDANKTIDIKLENTLVSDNQSIPNTGSYSAFGTSTKTGVNLTAGNYTLQVIMNDYGLNLDYIEFVPQFTVDCKGTLNGTSVVDACGICGGDGTSCKDCNGVKNGTAYKDQCGVCVGGTTGKTACKIDCNGTWGGSAKTDSCRVCAGGTTGKTPITVKSACITSIETIVYENILIYPNPVGNLLHIDGQNIEFVMLTDILGKVILNQVSDKNNIDVSSLPKGLYILTVKAKGQNPIREQIVVE